MANQELSKVLSFRTITRQQAKASIVIQGLSGKGKTGLALMIGCALADDDWSKVYAVDTENKSMDLFEGLRTHTGSTFKDIRKVDLLPSYGFAPTNYLICKENAIKAGAKVMINDSLTHAWQMEGGVLQRVSQIEKANRSVNKFSAWGTDEIVEEKNAIFNIIRDNRVHVIATIRLKEKHEMVTTDGKTTIQSLGEQQIFMPDFKYEPDLVLDMVRAGNPNGTTPAAKVIKSRYAIFVEGETYDFTEGLLKQLRDYLNEGVDPEQLKEQQRLELIKAVTDILDTNSSKKTLYPILKEQQGLKDIALTDMTLEQVRTLLTVLIN